jgi:hypothetical protein
MRFYLEDDKLIIYLSYLIYNFEIHLIKKLVGILSITIGIKLWFAPQISEH